MCEQINKVSITRRQTNATTYVHVKQLAVYSQSQRGIHDLMVTKCHLKEKNMRNFEGIIDLFTSRELISTLTLAGCHSLSRAHKCPFFIGYKSQQIDSPFMAQVSMIGQVC